MRYTLVDGHGNFGSDVYKRQDEDVVIYITNNHIVFEFENTTVVSRLIEGEYLSLIHI